MKDRKEKINLVSLGCSKNLIDSEVLISNINKQKYEVFHDGNSGGSDIAIINTCGFIGDAREEAVDTILEHVEAKKQGMIKKLLVMGCLPEKYKNELETEIPEVDEYYGKFELKRILQYLNKKEFTELEVEHRAITTPSHFAYLKISEGCNRTCSYCAIPQMTGLHKSRPMESLVREAENLAASGVKELLVIAQDLSYYGKDLYNEYKLPELVQKLSEVDGIEWIKLHYAYPSEFPYGILPVMRENPKVCRYLDMALQHISDPMLKKMRRVITKNKTYELLHRIREEVPGIALRTTFIAGHPGETEEDYKELKQFVQDFRFERFGVFAYSEEDNTYAARKYEDDIPFTIKQRRRKELMQMQQQISKEFNESLVNQTLKVIIDREEDEFYIGRTEFDSPEVDGEVLISKTQELKMGNFYDVKITGAEEYDLFGIVEC